MGKTYSLKTEQLLPCSLDDAWQFFSRPQNLANITPAHLGFNIVSTHHGEEMYAGQIIEYTVKPVLGIPLYWMTEITQVEKHRYFIDEQRFGPYTFWHHQHHFRAEAQGVFMTDIVHYRLPFWRLGSLAHSMFVKKQLKQIFDYRFQAAERHFSASIK